MTEKISKKIQSPILEKPFKVPTFHALKANGQKISNKDIIDSWHIVYFYPKDMTSGCTIEAQEFEKTSKKFASLNCTILGVSKDSCESHIKFAQKENLSFTLISDVNHEMCEVFKVWKEKKLYGKTFMGIERTTFIINPKGLVVCCFPKVKVTGHIEDVLKNLIFLQTNK